MEVKWIKVAANLFDDEKIILIESMPQGDSIIAIWMKLLCLAGKLNNGGIFTMRGIPYTDEMLSTILHKPLAIVRMALDTFEAFGMTERRGGAVAITNWDKHQNEDKMTEIREYNRLAQQKRRAKLASAQNVNDNVNDKSMTQPQNVNDCQDTEEEEEREKEKEIHSFTHSAHTREDEKRIRLKGMGKGLVFLSDEQLSDLCEKLSLDELEYYIGVVAEAEQSGHHYKKKSHYQAILDMAEKDRRVNK